MKRILQKAMIILPLKVIAITQISTASVSLLASSAMAFMILKTEKRLTTPYRRIIFGVSVADIIFSFGLVTGPMFLPQDIPNSWGVGNEGTCKVTGFTILLGVNCVSMYTCFLCWYYLCKLKFHMSNETFARRYEWKGHIFIALFCLALSLIALFLDTIHPTAFKSTCQLAVTPLGCRVFPSIVGECDATVETRVNVATFLNQGLRVFWLVVMIVTMGMLYRHVIVTNRIFQPSQSQTETRGHDGDSGDDDGHGDATANATSNTNTTNTNTNSNDPEVGASSSQAVLRRSQQSMSSTNTSRVNAQHLSTLYRNEIALQASCYVGAYCIVYIPVMIIYGYIITDRHPSKFFQALAFVLNPLGGLFMILVYTRPQIAHLRRNNLDYSRMKCFWLVLKAGGEIPEEPNDDEAGGASNTSAGPSDLRRRRRHHLQRLLRRCGGQDSMSSVQFGEEIIHSNASFNSQLGGKSVSQPPSASQPAFASHIPPSSSNGDLLIETDTASNALTRHEKKNVKLQPVSKGNDMYPGKDYYHKESGVENVSVAEMKGGSSCSISHQGRQQLHHQPQQQESQDHIMNMMVMDFPRTSPDDGDDKKNASKCFSKGGTDNQRKSGAAVSSSSSSNPYKSGISSNFTDSQLLDVSSLQIEDDPTNMKSLLETTNNDGRDSNNDDVLGLSTLVDSTTSRKPGSNDDDDESSPVWDIEITDDAARRRSAEQPDDISSLGAGISGLFDSCDVSSVSEVNMKIVRKSRFVSAGLK